MCKTCTSLPHQDLGWQYPEAKSSNTGPTVLFLCIWQEMRTFCWNCRQEVFGGVWEGSHGRARRRQHISCHDRVKGTWRDLIALGLPEISVYHKPAENFQKNRPEKCIHGKVIHFFLKGRMSLSLSKPKWFLWFMKKKTPSSKQIAKLPFGVNCVLVQGFLIRIKGLSVLCHMQFFCKRVVE